MIMQIRTKQEPRASHWNVIDTTVVLLYYCGLGSEFLQVHVVHEGRSVTVVSASLFQYLDTWQRAIQCTFNP